MNGKAIATRLRSMLRPPYVLRSVSSFPQALMFPGQGSQRCGMAKDLTANFKEAKYVYEEVDEATGSKISEISTNGSEEELSLTKNTQPALLAHSVALFRSIKVECDLFDSQLQAVLGHSVGEYIALVISGAISLTDAAKLLRLRGAVMQEAADSISGGDHSKFAMRAIVLSRSKPHTLESLEEVSASVASACSDISKTVGHHVSIASINSPQQLVLSGAADAVAGAADSLQNLGISKRSIPLRVSAPFHTPLMLPAADAVQQYISKAGVLKPSRVALFANVDASARTLPGDLQPALVDGITSPVKWAQCVHAVVETLSGGGTLMELAAAASVSTLSKQCDGVNKCRHTAITNTHDISQYLKQLG